MENIRQRSWKQTKQTVLDKSKDKQKHFKVDDTPNGRSPRKD